MANYWAAPDPNQFNFTPSTPPVQEALGALQAKTQYWLQGASQIKGQYDNILGKELSHATSLAKVEEFRKGFDEKLKTIAKQDLSIGENRTNALKEFDPIIRDRGILVDETTTSNYNNILAQAKTDATKNGGKYYNQDSVEYAGQMLQRYKSQGDNSNSEYNSILQANAYMPYNEKAQKELSDFVKTMAKERVKRDLPPDPNNPLYKVTVEEPAYSLSSLNALARETLSPAAMQMYELQGKVRFNRMQLAAKTPEELERIGSVYKQQFDDFANNKIEQLSFQKKENVQQSALLPKTEESKARLAAYQEQNIQIDGRIKELEKEKLDTKKEYFTDPAKWQLGESYASQLYIEQKIQNTGVALSNRRNSETFSLNQPEAKRQEFEIYKEKMRQAQAAAKAKADKEAGEQRDPTQVSRVNIDIGAGQTDPDKKAEEIYQELKHLEINAYTPLRSTLLKDLNINVLEDGEYKTLDLATPKGDILITDTNLGLESSGLDNLRNILTSATTNLPKDADGKVDLSKVTVAQVKINLDAILSDKNQMAKVLTYAAFENNDQTALSNYQYELSKLESSKNNKIDKFGKIYKDNLERNGIKYFDIVDGKRVDKAGFNILDFTNPENIKKLIPFADIERFGTGTLSELDKDKIAQYFTTGKDEYLNGINSFVQRELITGEHGIRYYENFYKIPNQIVGIKNNFQNAIKGIKEDIKKTDGLSYSMVQKTYNVIDKFTNSDSPNNSVLSTDIGELIDKGQGSIGGMNSEQSIQAFKVIQSTPALNQLISKVKFVVGSATGAEGYMEVELDMDKLASAKKAEMYNGDAKDLVEKIIDDNGKIKVYLPNEDISKYAQDPDRSRQGVFKNPIRISTSTGKEFTMKNTAVNQPGIVDLSLDGKITAIKSGGDGKIIIKNITFQPNNYEDLASLFAKDNSGKVFHTHESFKELLKTINVDAIGKKIVSQDAIAYTIQQQFGSKGTKNSDGDLVIDLSQLTKEEYAKFQNILNNRKLN